MQSIAAYCTRLQGRRRKYALLLASGSSFQPDGPGFESLAAHQRFRGVARRSDPKGCHQGPYRAVCANTGLVEVADDVLSTFLVPSADLASGDTRTIERKTPIFIEMSAASAASASAAPARNDVLTAMSTARRRGATRAGLGGQTRANAHHLVAASLEFVRN